MAVKQGEDGLQLGDSILVDVHEGRLIGLNHRQGPRVATLASGTAEGRVVYRAPIILPRGRRDRATVVEAVVGKGVGRGAFVADIIGRFASVVWR